MTQFWNITSGIYSEYHIQIMLLFVYTSTCKGFVIFTWRYFKLSWNTTVLSQSNCTNFLCSSCNLLLVMTFTKSTYQNLSQCRHIAFQDYTSPYGIFNLHIQVNVIERVCVIGPKVVEVYNWLLERLRFTFTANGKRQIQVENFSEYKISRYKQSRTILMDKTGIKLFIFE